MWLSNFTDLYIDVTNKFSEVIAGRCNLCALCKRTWVIFIVFPFSSVLVNTSAKRFYH